MKITHLASWYSTQTDAASGWFLHDYAKMNQQLSFESDVLFLKVEGMKFGVTEYERTYLETKARVFQTFGLPKKSHMLIRFYQNQSVYLFERYLKQYEKPDLIHAHSFLAGIQALAIFKKWGIPFVFTEHNSAFLRDAVPSVYHPFIQESIFHALFFSTVSKEMADTLFKRYKKQAKVIYNPIDTDFFNTNEAKKPAEHLRLFAFGDPPETKGLDRLLSFAQALKKERRFTLHVGDKIRDYTHWKREVMRMDLEEELVFTGFLSREEIRQKLHQCDAFLSFSRWETFGIAMCEALSCGVPVFSTRTSGPECYWEEVFGSLIENRNTTPPIHEFLSFLEARKNADILKEQAQQKFSYHSIGSKWAVVYEKVKNG